MRHIWPLALVAFVIIVGCSDTPNPNENKLASYPVLPDDPMYLEYKLGSYDLKEVENDGDIRFLWLRSFHDPVVFELTEDDEGRTYTAKVWKEGRWKTYAKKDLNDSDDPFLNSNELELFGFFDEPHYKKGELRFTDGATWLFEARSKGKHNWIFKQSPDENSREGRWGRKLIEASIDSPAVPIY